MAHHRRGVAAAVVLTALLLAFPVVGQRLSQYPWALLDGGTFLGPVYSLACGSGLSCTADAGAGFVSVSSAPYASSCGSCTAAGTAVTALFALDAGQALLAEFAADAGRAGRASAADFADDAGRSLISNFSDFAFDAGYAQSSGLAGVATYALDAGLAGRAFAADFASDAGFADLSNLAATAQLANLATFALDAGSAASADLATAALWAGDAGYSAAAGQAVLATYALDAGLAGKSLVSDFARDAGSAAAADLATAALWAGDAGYSLNAGAAALATYALDAGLSVAALFAADAGNLQCSACVGTSDITAGAVTSATLADLAVTAGKLDNGISIAAYDEAGPAAIFSRASGVDGASKQATYAGQGYIRFTVTGVGGGVTTTARVETGVAVDDSGDGLTSAAVVRYRASGAWLTGTGFALSAVNSAQPTETATFPVSADGAWHVAVADISGWSAGTFRLVMTGKPAAGAAYLDLSYVGTGNPGSGTGALISYQGNVGVGVATPGALLEVAQSASSGWAAQLTNTSTAANTTKTVGLEFRGTDTAGTEKQAALLQAVPADSNYVAAGLSLSTRSADTVAERVAISGAGVVTVNQPASGFALQVTGTASPSAAVINTSNAAATYPSFQVVNYGASGGFPVLATYSSRGTSSSPSGSSSGDVLGAWVHYGRVAAAFAEGARIDSVLTAAPGVSALTAALRFYTANGGASAERLRIAANGVVSLPSSGSLQVGNATWTTTANDILLSTSGASSVYLRPGGASSTNWQYEANGASAYHRWLGASGAQLLNLDGSGLTTSVGPHELGPNTDTATYIDLHGAAATYTDYTLRLLHNAGANGASEIIHRGTGTFSIGANESATLALRTAATNRLTISSAGVVTVANLAGTGNRAVYSDASGNLTNSSSDATLKTLVEDLQSPLRLVLNLRPVSFSWKDTERFGAQREVGFLAQEVMQVVPEVVGVNNDGTYTLDYAKLVAVVVGAIQELFDDRTWLARRVQELEDRAQRAEERLAQLESRLAALEAR